MSIEQKVDEIKKHVLAAFGIECKQHRESLKFNIPQLTRSGMWSLDALNEYCDEVTIKRSGTGLVVILTIS